VHVNGVRWDSVPTLYGRGPRERVYTTRLADDGSATVQFGDGASGARPPTGRENIQATYRRDSGEAGNLAVDQLSLPLTRPLGLKAVTNPLAVTGGTDPQALADARDNAPRTVLTLDRVVSLRDFELFAGTYAGIGKALATWTWDVDRRGVLITVAGPDGAPVSDAVRASLLGAIRAGGDPRVPVAVRAHRPIGFRLGATFAPDPERRVADVLAAIEAALRARFSFAARDFGQPVALSEAIAVIQAVPGVVAVDMDRLYRGSSAELRTLLTAASPAPGAPAATTDGAELLTIDLRSGDVQVAA
jgi:predicted phage baseplate assembly protein